MLPYIGSYYFADMGSVGFRDKHQVQGCKLNTHVSSRTKGLVLRGIPMQACEAFSGMAALQWTVDPDP